MCHDGKKFGNPWFNYFCDVNHTSTLNMLAYKIKTFFLKHESSKCLKNKNILCFLCNCCEIGPQLTQFYIQKKNNNLLYNCFV